MAFTGNYKCNSFKREILEAVHNMAAAAGHTFKMALYSSAATLNASTTAYSATNEVTGVNYAAGGVALTNNGTALSGTVAYADFADPVFTNVTLTCRGALIYNSSAANKSVCVLDFGSDKSPAGQNFTVTLPTPGATTAIVRID